MCGGVEVESVFAGSTAGIAEALRWWWRSEGMVHDSLGLLVIFLLWLIFQDLVPIGLQVGVLPEHHFNIVCATLGLGGG